MPGCTVPNCTNSSEKGYKLYHFPRDKDRSRIWVGNCGRELGWIPTRHTCICQVHFDENQFESHRADGLRKLKPYAVPTIFSTISRKNRHRGSPKLPACGLNYPIKIEEVTSLSDPAVFDPPVINDAKVSESKPEIESPEPKRKSARISIHGRRSWTNLFKRTRRTSTPPSSKDNSNSTQVQQTPNVEVSKTCPKEVRIVVERLPQPTEGSGSLELPPKRKIPQKTIKKSPKKKSEMPSKPRLKIEDDVERLMNMGEGSEQPDDDDDGVNCGSAKGCCAICSKHTDSGMLLDSLTLTSKMQFYLKLRKLASGESGLIVHEEGVLCSVCTRLLNYMDRIEVELSMLKTAFLNCMRKKCMPEKLPSRKEEDRIESQGEGDKLNEDVPDPKPICSQQDDLETVADHLQESHDFPDPAESEAVGQTHPDSEQQADLPCNQVDLPCDQVDLPCNQVDLPSDQADLPPDQINVPADASNNPYKCNICSYKTSFKSVIIFHLRQHLKNSFRCDFCNITIPQYSEQTKKAAIIRRKTFVTRSRKMKRVIASSVVNASENDFSSAEEMSGGTLLCNSKSDVDNLKGESQTELLSSNAPIEVEVPSDNAVDLQACEIVITSNSIEHVRDMPTVE